MGDPKKAKKGYKKPAHPWQSDRISEESKLLREYGLVNKKEIWRANSLLRKWRQQARSIIALTQEQRESAEKIIIEKLNNLGILHKGAQLDDVLSLNVRDILDKRLQTYIYKRGMSNTVRQARQFIVHNKVSVNGKLVNSPSYLVKSTDKINFTNGFSPEQVKKMIVSIDKQKIKDVEVTA